MPNRFVETHIQQLPLFAQMPPEHLRWFTEAFRVMRVEPGEFIFEQGQPSVGLYMFVSGRAQLIQTDDTGQQRTIGVIGTNQYLNEAALFKPGVETASLRVLETSTVLALSRQMFLNVVSHHPEVKPYLPHQVATVEEKRRTQVFRGQRENEAVLLDTRRHWWAFVRKAWFPAIISMTIIILSSFIPVPALVVALDGLAIIIPGLMMIYIYLEWYNDHIIITNQRVVHIERVIHTFQTRISEIPLVSIQEVNADLITSDPFSRIFNYGTVVLRTAGQAGNITLTVIPRPAYIQNLIFENRTRFQDDLHREHRNTIRAEVDRVLGRKEGDPSPLPEPTASQISGQGSWSPWQTRFINERGDLVFRKHFLYWLRATFWPGLWMLTSVMLGIFSLAVPPFNELGLIGPLFGFFLFLLGGIWFYLADWDWRNDMYVLKDDTIQLIHRRPLWMQNEHDQILLNSVDNVVSEQSGLFQQALDYGNVRIYLIGSDPSEAKVFRAVPKPRDVQAEITRRQSRMRRRAQEEEERRRREEIAEYLSVYHETVGTQGGAQPPPAAQSTTPSPDQFPGRSIRDRMRPPNVPRIRRNDDGSHNP